jgi:hypothetical protein
MRPAVKRRLVTLAAAASLLLCIATLALWVRSYWVGYSVEWGNGVDTGYGWTLHRHDIGISQGVVYYTHSRPFIVSFNSLGPSQSTHSVFLGFLIARGYWPLVPDGDHSAFRTVAGFPIWLPAFLTSLLPARWMFHLLKNRQRTSSQRCRTCGYDLRATPDRCPECGAAPARPPAT